MRILQVAEMLDPVHGGVAEGVYQQSVELLRLGHEVEVLSAEAEQVARFASHDIPHHAFAPTKEAWRFSPETMPWLMANVKRFDAVIINGLWMHPIHAAAKACAKLGVPYYVMPHGMMDPYFKSTAKKKLVKDIYWALFEKATFRHCRKVLFTTQAELDLASEAYPIGYCEKTVVGYGIVDPAPFAVGATSDVLSKFGLKSGEYDLFMSRVHPKKGLDLLVESIKDVGSKLVIAGNNQSDYAEEIRHRICELGVEDQIVWAGFIGGADKWSLLKNARSMVLPSHQENFGIIVAEACSLEVPVLVSRKVNTFTEIESAGAGVICDDTVESTKEAWKAVAGLSADAKSNARKCFEQNFQIESCTKRFLEAISQ